MAAVSPLSLDASHIGGPAASEAEALFTERARAHDPGFTAPPSLVREVCARLDGVPLALELAAARCASPDVDGLLAGLGDHLNLLSGSRSAHERHRQDRFAGWDRVGARYERSCTLCYCRTGPAKDSPNWTLWAASRRFSKKRSDSMGPPQSVSRNSLACCVAPDGERAEHRKELRRRRWGTARVTGRRRLPRPRASPAR